VASVLSKKVAFAMEGLQEFTHDDRILFWEKSGAIRSLSFQKK
jgi:hypothetical protein